MVLIFDCFIFDIDGEDFGDNIASSPTIASSPQINSSPKPTFQSPILNKIKSPLKLNVPFTSPSKPNKDAVQISPEFIRVLGKCHHHG